MNFSEKIALINECIINISLHCRDRVRYGPEVTCFGHVEFCRNIEFLIVPKVLFSTQEINAVNSCPIKVVCLGD